VDLLRELKDFGGQAEQRLVLALLLLDRPPLLVGQHAPPLVGGFWLIIRNVDRKMASRDTNMVSKPNG
jgi:hypothetical protein